MATDGQTLLAIFVPAPRGTMGLPESPLGHADHTPEVLLVQATDMGAAFPLAQTTASFRTRRQPLPNAVSRQFSVQLWTHVFARAMSWMHDTDLDQVLLNRRARDMGWNASVAPIMLSDTLVLAQKGRSARCVRGWRWDEGIDPLYGVSYIPDKVMATLRAQHPDVDPSNVSSTHLLYGVAPRIEADSAHQRLAHRQRLQRDLDGLARHLSATSGCRTHILPVFTV